jgi:dynein heavy chain
MEAVCILKGVKPTQVETSVPGSKVYSYWESSKKILGDIKFLQSLIEFDKDNIPPTTIEKIKPYVQNPEFRPEKIRRISRAAMSLCEWVRAIERYDTVLQQVRPKKIALMKAEKQLEIVTFNLNQKKGQLAVLEGRILLN